MKIKNKNKKGYTALHDIIFCKNSIKSVS